ncbi:NB-ARC domain-containing protein [Rhodococcus sp. NPDC058521]|uniref:NB-ARC domain-containing protein n=1 Tax=Rhodococcus sp. NPDC058521 TaxID=3346536 RepID=UPI00364F322E
MAVTDIKLFPVTHGNRNSAAHSEVLVIDDAADSLQIEHLANRFNYDIVLVTSRHRLCGIRFARSITLDVLDTSDSCELFGRTVGDERPAADPDAVISIVRKCGNLPLAINNIAARVRHRPMWSLSGFVKHIAEDGRRITELCIDERSVSLAFESSYNRLSFEQKQLFKLLGRLGTVEFDPHMVGKASSLTPAAAEHLLETLVDANMLQQSTPGTYEMHRLAILYSETISGTPDQKSAEGHRDGCRILPQAV